MKFASLDHFGLSAWRLACIGVAAASAAWLASEAALGGVLGEAKPAVLLLVSSLVFYLVVSIPRRLLDRARVQEARESVLLSASARACLQVTGSRPRTLMLVRPRVPSVARAVRESSRMVLLGVKVEDALTMASEGLASNSASVALRSLAVLGPEGLESGDDESRGLAYSSELSRETKLPMFMTACFFTPIMILLYAVFTQSYSPDSIAELVVLEFIIVDLAFYLSSADRSQR